MKLLITAFRFLTIIPLPFSSHGTAADLGRSTPFFPLVGLIIGAILLLADMLMSPFLPRHLTDALIVTLLAIITGALHHDGLADVCDGLAARGDRERFLEVMKDSRVGAVGVVGIALGFLLKYAALISLPVFMKRPVLLLFPAIARFVQVLVMAGAKGARSNGLGATFLSGMSKSSFSIAAAIIIPITWFLCKWAGLGALFSASVWGLMVRWYFTRRIGGITGDIVGFASETAEIAVLIKITAITSLMMRLQL